MLHNKAARSRCVGKLEDCICWSLFKIVRNCRSWILVWNIACWRDRGSATSVDGNRRLAGWSNSFYFAQFSLDWWKAVTDTELRIWTIVDCLETARMYLLKGNNVLIIRSGWCLKIIAAALERRLDKYYICVNQGEGERDRLDCVYIPMDLQPFSDSVKHSTRYTWLGLKTNRENDCVDRKLVT